MYNAQILEVFFVYRLIIICIKYYVGLYLLSLKISIIKLSNLFHSWEYIKMSLCASLIDMSTC